MIKKIIKQKSAAPSGHEYVQVLQEIKQHIREAQIKASLSVNKELLKLYWHIGQTIHEQQKLNGWGSKTIENLAQDIQSEFPGIEGFSRRNIFRMLSFFIAYQLVPQLVALIDDSPVFNIPWGHNAVLLEKLKDAQKRLWYAQKTIENGWSRSSLESWIESDLFGRQGKALTNFKNTLPAPYSDLAHDTLKNPYTFDFLALSETHMEKDVEQGLMDNVEKLLLEMGKGFALVARQYHVEIDEQDYFIDLLFYHTKLKCYFVVELKARKFDVKDLGQLSFYLSAVDDLVKDKDDKPTLGLLLCRTKKTITVEYALRNINRPIGVAAYSTKLVSQIPKDLKSSLPTIKQIETELKKVELVNMKMRKARKKKE